MGKYEFLASKIKDNIIADITDRRGFRQEWDNCDSEVQDAIENTWIEIIAKVLRQAEQKNIIRITDEN